MKSVDEMKEKVYASRVKHIEMRIELGMISKLDYAEVAINYITGAIKEELLAMGYRVEAKAIDPTIIIIGW